MYPYLYDKRHPSFKDRTKKDRAWADRKHVRHVDSHITAEEANERSPPRPRHAAERERAPDTAEETGVDTCSNE
ncbi:hypothetical protein MRX96_022649 [Rhipicephalus microplus]